MKKFRTKNRSKKTAILSVLLLAAVIGVGATIALAVAQTSPVVNTFEAGKIDTSIEEQVDTDMDTDMNKKVWVKNSAEAKNDAFVRVRINCPEEIDLKFSDASADTWKKGDDGFYYYLYSVAPGEKTTQLLDSVSIKAEFQDSVKSFDVTVYQESCVATGESHYGGSGPQPFSLEEIQEAFAKATTN